MACNKKPPGGGLVEFVFDIREHGAYALHMISFLVKLSDRQLLALRSLSKEMGISVSELIRRAVDRFLEK
jgi:Ribbon-helix-helix domain